MRSQDVLDRVTLKNGLTLVGIVDYVNKKHIHFFDFTNTDNPNLVLIAMVWRTSKSNLRFSVYSTINHPNIKIPNIKLIHRKDIKDSNIQIFTTPPEKKDRKTIKAKCLQE